MTQPNPNQQTPPKAPVPASNQAHPPHPTFPQPTDARIKEVVMETLIELDLIGRAQKKKAITLE
ncbi:MAG: hypothetical protein NWE96_09705 [Candidatus Bathyarchaeota archaeon]|nr:hypothetical protein [Candidatus Bathyarchaeota archaeon]